MKYAPYYLLVLIIFIGGIFIYLFCQKAIYLDNKMDELFGIVEDVNKDLRSEALNMANIDSQQRKIAAMQIEKESYSQMINRESDRMIYFVTGLFILFSLIGFGVFKLEIFNMKEDNNGKIDAAKKDQQGHRDEILKEIEKFKTEFLDLKLDHLHSSANMWAMASSVHEDLPGFSFWSSVQSAEDNISCSDLKKNTEYGLGVIKANLESAKKHINECQIDPSTFNAFFASDAEKLNDAKFCIIRAIGFKNEKISSLAAEILVVFNELVNKIPKQEDELAEKK